MHTYHPTPTRLHYPTSPSPAANFAYIWAAVDPDPDSGSCRSQIPAEKMRPVLREPTYACCRGGVWYVTLPAAQEPDRRSLIVATLDPATHFSSSPCCGNQCPLLKALLLCLLYCLLCSFLWFRYGSDFTQNHWGVAALPHPSEGQPAVLLWRLHPTGRRTTFSSSARLARTSFSRSWRL